MAQSAEIKPWINAVGLIAICEDGRRQAGSFRTLGELSKRRGPFFDDAPPSLVSVFRDIGLGVKGGLPLRPWATDLVKAVQTPALIIMMYESNYGLRQIFTDGRTLPGNYPQPGGMATPSARGTATRWWWKPRISGTAGGSTSTGIR